MKCFECGDLGHVATSCPNIEQLGDGRPMWDPSECGHHQETGKQWEHVETGARPVVRDEDALRAKALAQVAESRATRAIV